MTFYHLVGSFKIMNNRKIDLVKLAISYISSKGFDSFSYADLSKEFNISKASIHHYFPKKENLGLEVLEFVEVHMTEFFEEILSKHDSCNERLEYMFSRARECFCESKCNCPLFSLQGEWQIISESMQNKIKDIFEKEIDYISGMLEEGLKNDEISLNVNTRDKACEIICTYKGALQCTRSMGITFFDNVAKSILINIKK